MYCVFLVMCRALSFQSSGLSGCGLPGREAGRKELGGNEREKEGYRRSRVERFTCELRGLCHGNCIK